MLTCITPIYHKANRSFWLILNFKPPVLNAEAMDLNIKKCVDSHFTQTLKNTIRFNEPQAFVEISSVTHKGSGTPILVYRGFAYR